MINGNGELQPPVEVFNNSNTDPHGNVVSNDTQLLLLLQNYSFLYNPLSFAYQDPAFVEWAWMRITDDFNLSYRTNSQPSRYFSSSELQERWHTLASIIVGLSKSVDLNFIREPLRQILITMTSDAPRQQSKISASQLIVLENIDWVERLPFEEQRRLEAEMMDLILTAELKSEGEVRCSPAIERRVDREYEDFLKDIRLKELFVLSCNNLNCIDYDEQVEKKQELDDTNSCSSLSFEDIAEFDYESPILGIEEDPLATLSLRMDKQLVQPCLVRIKRLNLEKYLDVIPLAQFARFRKK